MREAGGRLMARDRLGRDVFFRGEPEGIRVVRTPQWGDTIYDLLKAYAEQRTREFGVHMQVKRAPVFAIEEARRRLERMIGLALSGAGSTCSCPRPPGLHELKRSALASTLLASLEMAKDGQLELRQASPFAPIFLRRPFRAPAEAANDSHA